MDHSRVPVIEALQAFRERGDAVYGRRGTSRAAAPTPASSTWWGAGVFASDVLTLNGLDDRLKTLRVVAE